MFQIIWSYFSQLMSRKASSIYFRLLVCYLIVVECKIYRFIAKKKIILGESMGAESREAHCNFVVTSAKTWEGAALFALITRCMFC
jgi:hypothetical protein